jgi:hypothetical protein
MAKGPSPDLLQKHQIFRVSMFLLDAYNNRNESVGSSKSKYTGSE